MFPHTNHYVANVSGSSNYSPCADGSAKRFMNEAKEAKKARRAKKTKKGFFAFFALLVLFASSFPTAPNHLLSYLQVEIIRNVTQLAGPLSLPAAPECNRPAAPFPPAAME
jgi:hypothetical protein